MYFSILRQLCSIYHSLSPLVFWSVVAALVLTKLNFGNATPAVIQPFQLDHLQAVMNVVARLIYQSSRYDRISPMLYHLQLALCAGAISIQTGHAGLPVCPWTCASLPAWCSTACRWTTWSTVDNACTHHRPRHWLYHWHGALWSMT